MDLSPSAALFLSVLAIVAMPPVRADAAAAALLALAALPPVLADAAAAALLALAAPPTVLADAAAATLLAPAALPPVLADADDTARETALPPCLHSKRRRSQLRSSRPTLRQRS